MYSIMMTCSLFPLSSPQIWITYEAHEARARGLALCLIPPLQKKLTKHKDKKGEMKKREGVHTAQPRGLRGLSSLTPPQKSQKLPLFF